MVQDPSTWITELMAAHFKKIIIHQEIGAALPGALRLIKSLGLRVGIAINPESDPLQAFEWWKELDTIQVMCVIPGHYGATFQPSSVEIIRTIRERGFTGEIEVDGGVTPRTAPTLALAGAKTFVVGHYLFGSEEAPELDKIGEKLNDVRAALGNPS
jgi:ribulose-phosphate 3-epimerase